MAPTPQPGIFAIGTRAHQHLQFDWVDGADLGELFGALRQVRDRATSVSGVNLVVGLGSELCARVAPAWLPDDVVPFATMRGSDGVAVAADQHDLWIWFHAAAPDAVFDAARHATAALRPVAALAVERTCFTYQASQDLTGFEDGTENPPLDEAIDLVQVPEGSAGAGSSVVLLQRWIHDLDAFDALDADARDQVIGRRLNGNEEIDPAERSEGSHISRVVVHDDRGDELEVFRRSTAYGGVGEHGLVFLAFSPDRARLDRMLARMVGLDGPRDLLTDISRCVESAWYVAPPVEAFREDYGCGGR